MKKILFLFIFLLIEVFPVKASDGVVNKVNIQASSYMVMERSTNKVIECINETSIRSVASISKIMTAIIAIENANVNDIVTIPAEVLKVYGSMVYLKVNEQIPLLDLIYALLLQIGNDAAVSIALYISQDIEHFVYLMNQKAAAIGMNDTLFRNPHGLDEIDGGNLSTSKDMAILQCYCLNNPLYREISGAKKYKTYVNKNRLINSYKYTTGGKTGYTVKARRTLITSAMQNDLEIVIVTLNCGNDFNMHENTYKYYFKQYEGIYALKKGKISLFDKTIMVNKEVIFMVSKGQNYTINHFIKNNLIEIRLIDSNNNLISIIVFKDFYYLS